MEIKFRTHPCYNCQGGGCTVCNGFGTIDYQIIKIKSPMSKKIINISLLETTYCNVQLLKNDEDCIKFYVLNHDQKTIEAECLYFKGKSEWRVLIHAKDVLKEYSWNLPTIEYRQLEAYLNELNIKLTKRDLREYVAATPQRVE